MESAMWLAYQRSLSVKSFGKSPAGNFEPMMLAVGLSRDDAEAMLRELNLDAVTHGRACVAAVNSPLSVTLSGDKPAISAAQSWCAARNLFARYGARVGQP